MYEMSGRTLILLLLVVCSTECFPQSNNNDDQLRRIVEEYGQADVAIPYSNHKNLEFLSRNVSIGNVRDKIIYVSLSPLTVEWFIAQKFSYNIVARRSVKSSESASDVKEAMAWDTWPTYLQYDSIMRSFVTLYPSLCRIDTIGTSNYGKLILALKISDRVSFDEDEPEVFYSSTIHGDEPSGFVLMLRLCDYLLKNYQTSGRIKNLVDNLEIWINPLANPDGTYLTGNTLISPVRFNSKKYDLNRNFPDPLKPYSASNIQQRETHFMVEFLQSHRFVISANFHSGAEVVNYPWDRWLASHPDDAWFYSISRAYADTVHRYSGPGYMNDLLNGVTQGYDWYPVYGGRQDYVTWELQGREVTIELNDPKEISPSQLPLLWEYNYRSLIQYLENALYGIHGKVENLKNSLPVPAKVFIKGHDADSSHVYSDTISGSFVRLISPGTWDLSFSATGYHDTTISNVVVVQDEKTDLIVRMKPDRYPVDTIAPSSAVIYPNPASAEIWALLADGMEGKLNIRIYNTSGKLLAEYESIAEKGFPLKIDLRRFAQGSYNIVFTNRQKGSQSKGRFIVLK
jgi:hypothetical protein